MAGEVPISPQLQELLSTGSITVQGRPVSEDIQLIFGEYVPGAVTGLVCEKDGIRVIYDVAGVSIEATFLPVIRPAT